MRHHERSERGLAGHLLCAVPQLLDPNFHRSAVLLLDHGADGALGLVLSNPMSTRMADVAQSLSLEWAGDPDAAVRLGGPVEQVRGWFLHDQASWDPEADSILDGLWVTTSLESVTRAGHLRFGDDGSRFVFLLGYAGWSGGQLEFEIAAGSWVVVPVIDRVGRAPAGSREMGVDVDFLFECEPEEMWSAALHAIGVDPQRLVGMQGSATLH